MPSPVDRLVELLLVPSVGDDVFEGGTPDDWPGPRVFGGLVAAQTLMAACQTVDPERRPHSLHAYFMRPGLPGQPIRYHVERLRDGRSFTTRGINAVQDETIFTAHVSFHHDEPGPEYQLPMAPDAPGPEGLPDMGAQMRRMAGRANFFLPFELREAGPTPPEPDGTYRSTRRVWFRTADRLPDDPLLHEGVIAFMSDMGVVMAARAPTDPPSWEAMMAASLDHAIWFHRPVRADDWLFYDLHALVNAGGRGLARGTMHTRDGRLVVSVTQEALLRSTTGRPAESPPGPEVA